MDDKLFTGRHRLMKGRSFGFYECGPEWAWAPPPFEYYDLWYVFSGEGEMRLNDVTYGLRKGVCILVQPGDAPVGRQNLDNRLTVLYLHFEPMNTETGEPVKGLPRLPSAYSLTEVSTDETIMLRLLELCDSAAAWREEEFDLLLRLVLLHLQRSAMTQADGSEPSGLHDKAVRKLKALIRTMSGQFPADKQLIEATGFSPVYANRIFRKATGQSIKQFSLQVKMERALHLMTETSLSVTQAAQSLGYSDVFYFSKQFKQHFGVSPTAYRK
ncbi:AraC family transcriptional regulator [Paenibacillus koleovorans]|uniref:AraC family transcriptional regulator n=1 Tax=Paenibacillus koleovorans TaxID=121608 RepID=UPI000FD7F8F1|nr:AraC family transcriptional regulator [Paenibacillus koleovorans]